jgi:hypothetical protein
MDNEEAKFILRAYRQSGADAGDAAFCAALEQAKRDPELGRWLEREMALDRAVATKLSGIAPPAGLRDAILAGGKMSVLRREDWWRQPRWTALAASIALLIGVVGAGWPRFAAVGEAQRFAEFAMEDLIEASDHAAHGPGMGQLAALVSDPTRGLGGPLPIEFDALKANGCRTVRFAGHDVLEVCFERAGKEFHFYVMKRPEKSRIRTGPDGMRFAKTSREQTVSAVWSDERYVYALVGTGDVGALRTLL